MSLGQRVKTRRKDLGLTREQLAVKAGLTMSTIGRVERGASQSAPVATVYALAQALGVTVEYLHIGDPSDEVSA